MKSPKLICYFVCRPCLNCFKYDHNWTDCASLSCDRLVCLENYFFIPLGKMYIPKCQGNFSPLAQSEISDLEQKFIGLSFDDRDEKGRAIIEANIFKKDPVWNVLPRPASLAKAFRPQHGLIQSDNPGDDVREANIQHGGGDEEVVFENLPERSKNHLSNDISQNQTKTSAPSKAKIASQNRISSIVEHNLLEQKQFQDPSFYDLRNTPYTVSDPLTFAANLADPLHHRKSRLQVDQHHQMPSSNSPIIKHKVRKEVPQNSYNKSMFVKIARQEKVLRRLLYSDSTTINELKTLLYSLLEYIFKIPDENVFWFNLWTSKTADLALKVHTVEMSGKPLPYVPVNLSKEAIYDRLLFAFSKQDKVRHSSEFRPLLVITAKACMILNHFPGEKKMDKDLFSVAITRLSSRLQNRYYTNLSEGKYGGDASLHGLLAFICDNLKRSFLCRDLGTIPRAIAHQLSTVLHLCFRCFTEGHHKKECTEAAVSLEDLVWLI